MSVAFVKEESAETAAELHLPERPISPHPNLVSPHGLELLKEALLAARHGHEEAQTIEDINERRRASAPFLRDLTYFTRRLDSAQVIPAPGNANHVAFGSRVTFSRQDGRQQSFTIVGEDEADPRTGSISFVSPVARALTGKSVGDVAQVGNDEIEILAIR
jgi:transcription elongation GreA/GreB family factor